MIERPILFNAPMVRALLDDRKTNTRRTNGLDSYNREPDAYELLGLIEHPSDCFGARFVRKGITSFTRCPYGKPGDRLWVREAWKGTWHVRETTNFHLEYVADGSERHLRVDEEYQLPKSAVNPKNIMTPLFMPRWASRITLEIAEVRVQRLHDITERDAIAEGIVGHGFNNTPYRFNHHSSTDMSAMLASGQPVSFEETAREGFLKLWESINGHDSVIANPWVWAVTFKRVEAPHA